MLVVSLSGSRQIAQGSIVSRLPQIGDGRIASAALANAAASGSSRLSRRLIKYSAARLAERGPRPGSLARSWIKVSSSDIACVGRRLRPPPSRVAGGVHEDSLEREL